MKEELQYQMNPGYVENLLKLRYEHAMRLWKEAKDGSSLSFMVNITTGILEEYILNEPPFKEQISGCTYQDQLQYLLSMIEDEEERAVTKNLIELKYLVETFEQGGQEVTIAYRRKLKNNDLKWVRCRIEMVLEPEKRQIIGFGIENEIEKTWDNKTWGKAMLNHAYKNTIDGYDNVLGMDYKTYIYDAIQIDEKHKKVFPIKGNIGTLIDEIHKFYHENSYGFLDLMRSVDRLRTELEDKKQIIWEVKVKSEKKDVYFWYEHRVLPVEEDKNICNYFLLLTIDITKRKEKEEALKEALAREERAGVAKQILLSHISHEIRTPLNGILGMLPLIQEELGREKNEYLTAIVNSSKQLKSLLNDVLDMSRLESGKVKLQKSWMRNEDFFTYIDSIIEPMARKKGIHYSSQYKQIFNTIYVDAGRLQQIMINLLINAIKYNHEGGNVSLSVDTEVLYGNYSKVFFCVEDDGKGMSEEFQKRAFDPFEQEEQSEIKHGAGIGLTIAKMLVSMMEGTITIHSKQNVGTKIIVVIEAIGKNKSGEGEDFFNDSIIDYTDPKKRCLLIEDDIVNTEIVQTYIKRMGISVDTASDGLAGINLFKNSEEGYYDFVLMDVILPNINGLEAAERIRNLQRQDARQVPIVAMTAKVFTEDIRRVYECGMNYFLSKPFVKEELQDLIIKILRHKVNA